MSFLDNDYLTSDTSDGEYFSSVQSYGDIPESPSKTVAIRKVTSWNLYYIDYQRLKKIIFEFRSGQYDVAHSSRSSYKKDYAAFLNSFERKFVNALEVELSKINNFFENTKNQISNSLLNLAKIANRETKNRALFMQELQQKQNRRREDKGKGKDEGEGLGGFETEKEEMEEKKRMERKAAMNNELQTQIEVQKESLLNLQGFISANCLLFSKILKKHDKYTGMVTSAWYRKRLETQPFCQPESMLKLLYEFSRTCMYCNRLTKLNVLDAISSPLSAVFLNSPALPRRSPLGGGAGGVKESPRLKLTGESPVSPSLERMSVLNAFTLANKEKGQLTYPSSLPSHLPSSTPSSTSGSAPLTSFDSSPFRASSPSPSPSPSPSSSSSSSSGSKLSESTEMSVTGGYLKINKSNNHLVQKFMIRKEDVISVKLNLARYCPLSSLLEEKKGGGLELGEEGEDIARAAAASQSFFCYLDNFETFTEAERRAGMKSRVEVYRIRYDESMKNHYILEKKCYFPQGSKKSRESSSIQIPLPDYALSSFLSGDYSKEEYSQELSSMGETEAAQQHYLEEFVNAQNHIVSKKLRPIFSTRCQTTEFEVKEPRLKFCLEENIVLNKHDNHFPGFEKENLQRRQTAFVDPKKQQALITHEKFDDFERLTLPSAILSISVDDASQKGDEDFSWLKEFLEMPELIRIQSFSKWIFGCAMLMPHQMSTKPKWLGEYLRLFAPSINERGFPLLSSPSPTIKRMVQPSLQKRKNRVKKMDSDASDFSLATTVKRDSNEGRVREDGAYDFPPLLTRLAAAFSGETEEVYISSWSSRYDEPKTYLANERVFCHWMKKVIIVAGYAIFLFKRGLNDSNNGLDLFLALLLFALGLCSLAYALYVFRWRAGRITNYQIDRPTLDGYNPSVFFEDNFGPFLFFFVMGLIAIVRFVIATN